MPTPEAYRLPGSSEGRALRDRLFTFNIVVTGRCNAACTYCHFYLSHDRKAYAYDIPDDLFDLYMDVINLWCETIPGTTTYRFSGGDPMVLGDRLFVLADRGFRRTGKRPFILTAGKALTETWVKRAQQSAIGHVFVSIENPMMPDPGAPDPLRVVQAINDFNSPELPIVPGVCVVPNECFKHLYDICAWFYERLGRIPIISEINYAAYVSPTAEQWDDLERNVERVVRDFARVTPLNLFSSVSPELSYGSRDPYIFELDLDNSYQFTADNFRQRLSAITDKLVSKNYPPLRCANTGCDWWEFCDNTKWYWHGDRNNPSAVKLRDYCQFKRLLNDIYYRVLVDPSHVKNEWAIEV